MFWTWVRGLLRRFTEMSLTRQFALAGGLVAIASMLVIGAWVSRRIETDSIANAAASTARYMDSFIAPLAQELQSQPTFSIGPIRALDEILDGPELKGRVIAIKIWKPDGTIAYARDEALIGQKFPISAGLQGALAGETIAELDELDEAESEDEAAVGIPLLEIYSPIRAEWTGDIIGVAEFYENASQLVGQIERARLQGWLVTAGASALICLSLFGIVYRGDRMIAAQRRALAEKLGEVEHAAEQNRLLREQVQGAARRFSELTEGNLRRVGADLHDGPAQLIGLVSLRLDALQRAPEKNQKLVYKEIAGTLEAALSEIRQISRGLVLPELDALTIEQVIHRAIDTHCARTHAVVRRDVAVGTTATSDAAKICAYRFLQEGLNNASRHGTDETASVEAKMAGGRLILTLRNLAPLPLPPRSRRGIGLAGLRDRVESLGGRFRFDLTPAGQAVLEMELDIGRDALDG